LTVNNSITFKCCYLSADSRDMDPGRTFQ